MSNIKVGICGCDRHYIPSVVYKTIILKPNHCCNKNILTQDMLNEENVKYVIKYNFNLDGQTITVPKNCILEFDGGSIFNGFLSSNDTILSGYYSSSVNSLFGVFYDKNKKPMGYDKEVIGDWKSTTIYGNFISCIEPGEFFGNNQSMVMDNNYVYLIFSQDYISDNKTLAHVAIVVYDRNYNYIGYSLLDRSSHANGATIYDNKIYIACDSRVEDNDTVHIVDIPTLLENAIYNKGKMRADSRITPVTPERLGYFIYSIDYDPVTNTFALGQGSPTYRICDTELNTIKISNIGDYRVYGENTFGRKTTIQDFVYQNGVLFIGDWDYDIEAGDSMPASTGVVYTVDVATDKVVSAQPLYFNFVLAETEGMCKDPLTGDIYIGCKNHAWYNYAESATVCRITYNNEKVSNDSRQIIKDTHWISEGDSSPIFVNNEYHDGISCGSAQYPYKTLGEALVMAGGITKRHEFFIKPSNEPYYLSNDIRLSDIEILLAGDTESDNKPQIDGGLIFRNSTVTIQNLLFNPSLKHGKRDAILAFDQHCNVRILDSTFRITEEYGENKPGKFLRSCSANLNCFMQVNGIELDSVNETTSHINLTDGILIDNHPTGGGGNRLLIGSATVNNGNFFNLNKDSYAVFNNIQKVTLTGNALLVWSDYRQPQNCRLNNVDTLEGLKKVKELFYSEDNSRTLPPYAISFFISLSIFDEDSNYYVIGEYTNDVINGETPVLRSLNDGNLKDGISACKSVGNLPLSTMIGRHTYVTDDNVSLWADGINWRTAEGVIAGNVESFVKSAGVNLIKQSEEPVLRNSTEILTPCDNTWRLTGSSYPDKGPAIVSLSVGILPDVKKGFSFIERNTASDVAYEIPFVPGNYTVSYYVKGNGTVKVQMGTGSNYLLKGFVINSPDDYTHVQATFTITNQRNPNNTISVYIGAESGTVATIIAVKCERGSSATAWKLDASHGASANRPTQASIGESFFDTTLNKVIYYTGDISVGANGWVDALGNNPDANS